MTRIILGIVAAALIAGGIHHCAKVAEQRDNARAESAAARAELAACEMAAQAALQRAAERASAAMAAQDQARAQAQQNALRADYELSKPAPVRGDDCSSARLRAQQWLQTRGAK